MAVVGVNDSSGLAARVGWLGQKVGSAWRCSQESSGEPSELSQWLYHDNNSINVVLTVIVIIIINIIIVVVVVF